PRKAVEKGNWDQIRHRIETFRHHPGLLCWGEEERVARGLTRLTNIAALYRLVHKLDPDHPLVLGDTRDVIKKFEHDRRDFFPGKAVEKGNWDQIRHRIETFRHHPGLLCWGEEERVARGLTRLTNIAALYRLVHKLDPDHPLVLGDTRDVIKKFEHDRRDFFP